MNILYLSENVVLYCIYVTMYKYIVFM